MRASLKDNFQETGPLASATKAVVIPDWLSDRAHCTFTQQMVLFFSFFLFLIFFSTLDSRKLGDKASRLVLVSPASGQAPSTSLCLTNPITSLSHDITMQGAGTMAVTCQAVSWEVII